jgi:sarcosine oxidase delta subunit
MPAESLPEVASQRMICPRCGESRQISDFAQDRSKASGRKSHCRPCDSAKARRYYEANREAVIRRVSAQQKAKRELAQRFERES